MKFDQNDLGAIYELLEYLSKNPGNTIYQFAQDYNYESDYIICLLKDLANIYANQKDLS